LRLIGGHDYYDCVLAMGIDPTIMLVRGKSKTISVDKAGGSLLNRRLVLKPEWSTERNEVRIHNIAVAFCGKVYRGIQGLHGFDKPEGIWSAYRAQSFVAQQKKRSVEVDTRWFDKRDKMTLEQWFTPYESSGDLREYMIANKISILVEEQVLQHEERYFSVNPFTLKKIGFAKAVDPYTAFQELSMWIGGVLGGTSPEIVTIKDDKTLIEGHGFDNQFSFRGPRLA
jgi:hypothetical protein